MGGELGRFRLHRNGAQFAYFPLVSTMGIHFDKKRTGMRQCRNNVLPVPLPSLRTPRNAAET